MAATVFKRPAGSFYIRLFLSRREIWTSLRTKDPCIARLRGAVLTGRIASATLLSEGYMTRENMKQIVKQFVREIIQRGEEDRASRTKIMESERQAGPKRQICASNGEAANGEAASKQVCTSVCHLVLVR